VHSFCFVQTGLVSGNCDGAGGIRETLTLWTLKQIYTTFSSYLAENAVCFD